MSEWISVKDRLPTVGQICVTYAFDSFYRMWGFHVDRYMANGWLIGDGIGNHAVSHWMPLPEPPKEARK